MGRSFQYSHMYSKAINLDAKYYGLWIETNNEFYRELSKHWLKRAGDYANKAAKEFANGR